MEFKILGPLEVCEGDRRLSCRGQKQRSAARHPPAARERGRVERSPDRRAVGRAAAQGRGEGAPDARLAAAGRCSSRSGHAGGAGRILQTRPIGLRAAGGARPARPASASSGPSPGSKAAAATGRAGEAARSCTRPCRSGAVRPSRTWASRLPCRPTSRGWRSCASTALEARFDADLALGRHAALIGELEAHLGRAPAPRATARAAHARALPRRAARPRRSRLPRRPARARRGARARAGPRSCSELERRDPRAGPEPRPSPGEAWRRGAAAARPGASSSDARPSWPSCSPCSIPRCRARGAWSWSGRRAGDRQEPARREPGRARERRGAHVLVGRCWEAGGAPAYWPWVQVLRTYVRDSDPELLRSQAGTGRRRTGARSCRSCANALPDLPPPPRRGVRGRRGSGVRRGGVVPRARGRGEAARDLPRRPACRGRARRSCCCASSRRQLASAPILIVGCYRDTEVGPGIRSRRRCRS